MSDNLWTVATNIAVTLTAVLSTTILLHRSDTHGALVLHPVVDWLFRCALWLTTGIYRPNWIALHRKHHKFTDMELDPHSPLVKGLGHIQWGNLYYYIKGTQESGLVEKYAPKLRHDAWDKWLFNNGFLGLGLGIFFLIMFLGLWRGLLVSVVHAFLYVVVISGSINGICHVWGYKNFRNVPGTNIRLLSWLTGGESLHNNHHAYPTSPKFSFRRSEFDPSWIVIWVLTHLGLATRSQTIKEQMA